MRHILPRFAPEPSPVSSRERLRSALGALTGVLLTGILGAIAVDGGTLAPALIAPMGASAVLLFAVPASPLAQPWSILCGNTVSALVGVTAAVFIEDPFWASAFAIGIAILVMMTLHCLHPPSGAIALTAVLGGPAIHDLGYNFVLWPVLGNSLALLLVALVFNNLTGRAYPRPIKPVTTNHGTSDPPPARRVGFTSDDLDDVLENYDQFLDINREDLEEILWRTELRSYRRRAGHLDCSAVMSKDVVAVAPENSLKEAHHLMRSHHIKALPVTNDRAEVVGIVTQTDLLEKVAWNGRRPAIGFLHRVKLALSGVAAPNDTVSDIMTTPVNTINHDAPLADAIILFAEQGLHYLPVTRENDKLTGIISQSDVLAAILADQAVGPAVNKASSPVP